VVICPPYSRFYKIKVAVLCPFTYNEVSLFEMYFLHTA